MRFEEFEAAARRAFDRIPPEYRTGVDALRVEREALPHPTAPEVYTLGECVTEAYPSDWEGPETVRSVVVLYHGSFVRLSEMDPEFDWDEELWETLTHEIRHHLEWLAMEDDLERVDYAMDEEFKRWEGEPFDPWYFQYGDPVDEGVYRVENRFYLEQRWRPEEFEEAERIEFAWRGRTFAVRRPDALGDLHFVWLHGLDAGAATVELVLVRRTGWWEKLRRLFRGDEARVLQSEAEVRPVDPGRR